MDYQVRSALLLRPSTSRLAAPHALMHPGGDSEADS
jgi:hypothetical protein